MHDGIMIGSDCADWWERHIKDFKNDLGDYVESHPGNFSVIVATAGATLADLGDAFIVDPLRLGEGVAEGSWRGVVQDTFRVLSFIPPARVFKMAAGVRAATAAAKTARVLEAADAFKAVEGGKCVPIAIAQAMKTAGYKLGVSLTNIARAIGLDLKVIAESGTLERLIEPALKKLGIVFETMEPGIKSFRELMAAARKAGGPMMVRLEADVMEAGKIVVKGHRNLIAEVDGAIQIVDRYGRFRTLEQLSQEYGVSFRVGRSEPIYIFKNVLVDPNLLKLVNNLGILSCLVRVSMAVLDFNKSKPDGFVQQDFATFLKQRGKTPPIREEEVKIQGGKAVLVRHGDTLSGIAMAEYRSFDLWPLIYDLNKDRIGPNPNRLQAGLKLLVLPLRTYNPQEIAAARRRASNWRH
ncbi:MAG TPA: LysM domain-containing protein [Terracidiphilus sp.]|nr:LysM domain-containing protein [Terracidiphilus sp.]